MSGPRITDAAVEAGARAQWALWWSGEDEVDDFDAPENLDDRDAFMRDSEAALAAALPHIRRAIIEELVEKARARMKALQEHRIVDDTPEADEWETVARTWGWLRAELEGDDRG